MNDKSLLKWISGLVFVLLIVALALTSRSSDRRLSKINALIEAKKIAVVHQELQLRLEQQFRWIADNAEVMLPLNVNAPISRDHLDLVVTNPIAQKWTGCGIGNAIYDSALNAIYIDESLIEPISVTALGRDSDSGEGLVSAYDIAADFLSFIIAHEIGHHKLHGGKTAAFFQFEETAKSDGSKRQENEADEFAVNVLSNANTESNRPFFLKQAIGLEVIHLDLSEEELMQKEIAYGRVLGSLVVMNMLLLFAESPYSPYFFDKEHPSFLERASKAFDATSSSEQQQLFLTHAGFFAKEIQRYNEMSHFAHMELYLKHPVLRVASDKDKLLIGTRPFGEGRAHVFQIPIVDLIERLARGITTVEYSLTDESTAIASPGDWLRDYFSRFEVADGHQAHGNAEFSRVDQSYDTFSDFQNAKARVLEQLPVILSQFVRETNADVDSIYFHWKGGEWQVCAVVGDVGYQSAYSMTITNGVSLRLDTPQLLYEDLPENHFKAICSKEEWLFLSLSFSQDSEQLLVWQSDLNGNARLLVQTELLLSGLAKGANSTLLRDRDISDEGVIRISDSTFIITLEEDSIYLLDTNFSSLQTLFHPARDVNVTRVSESIAAIWIYNGNKIYIVKL